MLLITQHEALTLLIGWLFAGLALCCARQTLVVAVIVVSALQAAIQASLPGSNAWSMLPLPLSALPMLLGAQLSLLILAGNALLAFAVWLSMQLLRRYASHCAALYQQRFETLVAQDSGTLR